MVLMERAALLQFSQPGTLRTSLVSVPGGRLRIVGVGDRHLKGTQFGKALLQGYNPALSS